ncbi:MAG TPA: hypothetical protein VMV75_07540, partial [Sulfuricella sp.]|nr:hypothetical protein [Sulfuricella sp.]
VQLQGADHEEIVLKTPQYPPDHVLFFHDILLMHPGAPRSSYLSAPCQQTCICTALLLYDAYNVPALIQVVGNCAGIGIYRKYIKDPIQLGRPKPAKFADFAAQPNNAKSMGSHSNDTNLSQM